MMYLSCRSGVIVAADSSLYETSEMRHRSKEVCLARRRVGNDVLADACKGHAQPTLWLSIGQSACPATPYGCESRLLC